CAASGLPLVLCCLATGGALPPLPLLRRRRFAATPPPAVHTLSLHDALPIFWADQLRTRLGIPEFGLSPLGAEGSLLGRALSVGEIGRAHVRTPVTFRSRMPSSA